MSDTIPDLWPDEYSDQEANSPESLLRAQAQMLAARSRHLLASVKRTDDGKLLTLEFMLSLADGTRMTRLCSMYHPVDRCYPVRVNAEGLGHHVANTQQQFLTLLAEVLRNPLVKSGVESLRAAALTQQVKSNGSPRIGEASSGPSAT
ncbi:MAG: hypothetical protein MPJ50_08850 [Pirellulales bacterium]|nr:hypothetical protein [Pirellulales bacterium]